MEVLVPHQDPPAGKGCSWLCAVAGPEPVDILLCLQINWQSDKGVDVEEKSVVGHESHM